MSERKHKFIRIQFGNEDRILELCTLKEPPVSPDYGVACPCCQNKLEPVMDVIQYGMWEDKFIVLFVCGECSKAFWYHYTLPLFELTEESHDRTPERP